MNKEDLEYLNFEYKADELSAYMLSLDTFVISLKNGKVVRYEAEDAEKFLSWLKEHNVRDVNEEFN